MALEPRQVPAYAKAITDAGGQVTAVTSEVTALIWTDYSAPEPLQAILNANPQLEWVQLPFAGVDAFAEILDNPIVFTSAKRSYSEPVAEHALALCMALARIIPERVRAKTWGRQFVDSLYDQDVLIVGGGGVAEELASLLMPFRSKVTIVRNRPNEAFLEGFTGRVVSFDHFDQEVARAKFVILACALTEKTRFLFDARVFELMRTDSYLVNIARGEVVNQEDLVAALESGSIAAAATDVTYPEPLPEGHAMWRAENLLITPHTADTTEIVTKLLSDRVRRNVSAWLAGRPLVGIVDAELGY